MSDHAGTIHVVPGHLRALGESVSRCAGPVASAARTVHGMGALSAATPVGPALADFRAGWSGLLALVAEDVARCGLALLAAAEAWETREADLARSIAGSAGRAPASGSGRRAPA